MNRSIRKRGVALALVLGAVLTGVPVMLAAESLQGVERSTKAKSANNKAYIVRMAEPPVVAFDGGGASGLKATRPGKGAKINPNSQDVARYADFLTQKHDATLAAVGGGRKLYSYKYTFNGFAAQLSDTQVLKLKAMPGVLAVEEDEARPVDTSSTPAFLGLDAPGGLWEQLGGAVIARGPNSGGAGEGIIIGIVDGGIWPEHPSVSDRDADGKRVYQQLPGWHGKCVPGDAFNGSNCNQKLIGAQFFNAGWGGNAGISEQLPWEYNSPRDFGGHGTHTATTSGGNHLVPATGDASVFGKISGIAPRARIAAYKVCWETPTGGSCQTSDSVAAIDQAVADGVDVINYSISGIDNQLPRLRRDRVPVCCGRGRVRRSFSGQCRSDRSDGRASRAVAHHGRGGNTQSGRNRLGDAGQWRDLQRRVGGVRRRSRADHQFDQCRASWRRSDAALAVLRRRRWRCRARSSESCRQDRRVRSRRHGAHQQESRGPARRVAPA